MLAVLASTLDPAARELVAAWSTAGAALISAQDLSSEGWSFRVADPRGGVAVVEGRRVPVRELEAVLTRRPAVLAEELAWIDPADRAYLAAETNAFLVAWLHALPCPVFNRPTPNALTGPAWGPLHWASAAAGAGVGWVTREHGPTHDVVVCGTACVGAASPAEVADARALARTARVELLGVRFCAQGACAATPSPCLDEEEVRAGVLSQMLPRPQ